MLIDLNLTSLSADPAVAYLKWVREQAYGDTPNAIQAALRNLDPDVANEAYLIVLGLPSLTSRDPVGFAVQDPFDDSFPILYLDPKYDPQKKARITGVNHLTFKLSGSPLKSVQQLTRVNFDTL